MRSLLLIIALSANPLLGCTPAPTPAELAFDSGNKSFELGDHKAAIVEINRALEAGHPDPASVKTALGNVYEAMGELERAESYHREALQQAPDHHAAWVNLGTVQRRQGEYTAAAESYAKAEAIAPDYAQLHASRGALLIFTGKPMEAEIALRRAIELDPNLAVTHANLAVALADQGDHEAAEASLKIAVEKGYPSGDAVRERIARP